MQINLTMFFFRSFLHRGNMCCLLRAPVKKDELLCFSTTGGPMKSDFDFSVIERRFGSDCNLARITRREVRSYEAS